MSFRTGIFCADLAIVAAWAVLGFAGCALPPQPKPTPSSQAVVPLPRVSSGGETAPLIAPVAYRQLMVQPLPAVEMDLANQQQELDLESLLQAVSSRNQSLQAMIATWQAAAQRYPQAISLDDPMLALMMAPASFFSNQVQPGYVVGASQKIPWAGKRSLRGQMASFDAQAAHMDVHDLQLRLAETTRLAYYDYYLVRRQFELNIVNLQNVQEFRDTAKGKYEANLVSQQDVLQAEVELATLERRKLELQRMDMVATARINTLLHRMPDYPLPPPPQQLVAISDVPSIELLRQVAVERRPDLAAMAARIRSERAALNLAYKEFYPDFELMGRYDSFWQPDSQQSLRPQIALNMDVPVRLDRRRAAAKEAMFRLAQRRAEYGQRVDDINQEVQSAYAQLVESLGVVNLYSTRTMPAATSNVEAARSGYVTGRVDFLRLVEAQRQLIVLREEQQQAIADYHRRKAELERVLGGPMPNVPAAEEIGPGAPLPIPPSE
jgi:cobalt-zinc-cadmium efflux system outer membrane protein